MAEQIDKYKIIKKINSCGNADVVVVEDVNRELLLLKFFEKDCSNEPQR